MVFFVGKAPGQQMCRRHKGTSTQCVWMCMFAALSDCLSVSVYFYVCVGLSSCHSMFICLSGALSVSVCLSVCHCLCVCPFVCLLVSVSVCHCLPVCVSVSLCMSPHLISW